MVGESTRYRLLMDNYFIHARRIMENEIIELVRGLNIDTFQCHMLITSSYSNRDLS